MTQKTMGLTEQEVRDRLKLCTDKAVLDEVYAFGQRCSVIGDFPDQLQHRGGRTAAILASLTSGCRRHEMDPQLYFIQLLMNFPSWPANDLDAWLPDRWKQAHAARCEALEIPPS